MEIIKNPDKMQEQSILLKGQGKTIALAPTMGFFHEGHLSLMRLARQKADILVVSNFVNPTQFSPSEDLESYPRDFERDCQMAESVPVDIMFSPKNEDMYPEGFRTRVEVIEWARKLCGTTRPTHFQGVTTIVLKLFNLVKPDAAVFGWKDAQQFLILRRMVKDLNLPIEMIGGEIVREPDGLAMSSRNRYLSPEERSEATILSRSLGEVREMIDRGIKDTKKLKAHIQNAVAGTKTGKLDYAEVVSMDALKPLSEPHKGNTLIAVAVYFGKARLIDKIRY